MAVIRRANDGKLPGEPIIGVGKASTVSTEAEGAGVQEAEAHVSEGDVEQQLGVQHKLFNVDAAASFLHSRRGLVVGLTVCCIA